MRSDGRHDPKIFFGPAAAPSPEIFGTRQEPDHVLRILTVEERVGAPRRNELVRVPLFFHEGECLDPQALQVVPIGAGTPIPYQADDIRPAPDRGIARMHLYFYLDQLRPWERKQFHLIRGKNPGADLPPLNITEKDGLVTLAGESIRLSFYSTGETTGGIAAIQTAAGHVDLPDHLLAPKLTLIRQDAKLKHVRKNEISYANPDSVDIRDLRWGAGPLFAKLILTIAPKGAPDLAEFAFIVPQHGNYFIQTERLFPEEKDSPDVVGAASQNHCLLFGRMVLGGSEPEQEIKLVSAGLRARVRSVHAHSYTALCNAKARVSVFPIPYVSEGSGGVQYDEETDGFRFTGAPGFLRHGAGNSGSLRVFWGQLTYVFSNASTEDALWEIGRKTFGSITAVVDEPSATPEHFSRFAAEVAKEFWNIQYWGKSWEQTAALYALGRQDEQAHKELGKELKVAANTDPYHLTYGTSGMVPLAAFIAPSAKIDEIALAVARSSRENNGTIDRYGFPVLKSFANALNMHLGTYLMGLWAGGRKGDAGLAQWSRDALLNEAIQAVYGRGQRPYTVLAGSRGASDFLYECISDLWLRTIELTCNEDLSLHPAAMNRYLDCIDVNADLYQRHLPERPKSAPAWDRAAMLRGQTHDHRWEAWDCAPYLGMLANAADGGQVGLTEACYYLHSRIGFPINWSQLHPLFFSEVNLRLGLRQYNPAPRPSLPANIQVKAVEGGNAVTWSPVPGPIAGYRIYRADHKGGPWTYVNSPYVQPAGSLVTETSFHDPAGQPGSHYFVTAQDKNGRESRWFPEEPLPAAGN